MCKLDKCSKMLARYYKINALCNKLSKIHGISNLTVPSLPHGTGISLVHSYGIPSLALVPEGFSEIM